MSVFRVSLIAAIVAVCPWMRGADAFSQAISSASVAQQTSATITSPLERRISLDLTNVPLPRAVDEISNRAGVRIVYVKDQLVSRPRVTVRNESITAANALAQVLRNTGLELSSYSGALAIVERSKTSVGKRLAQGVIAGKVIDAKTGKGISGASVSLGSDNRRAVSDEDGFYRLAGISAGTHTVTVRLVGYAKQTRLVTVGEGAVVAIDFKLEPSANVLNDVVVTGTVTSTELKAVPNAITVITAKQIEERGITRIDQLFRGDIPGLFSLNQGSSAALDEITMFSRGATALTNISAGTDKGTNPIKTYIDGVEMVDAQYLSQIDPSSIERIEILTGPQASTIYGSNAINGVMQIFTKRSSSSKPQLTLTLSSGIAQNSSNSHLAPEYLTDGRISGTDSRWSYNIGGSWNYVGAWTPSKQTKRLSINGGGRIDLGNFAVDVSARHGLTQNRQNGDPLQGTVELRSTGIWSPVNSLGQPTGLPMPHTQALLGHTIGLALSYRPFSWWSHDVNVGRDASTTEDTIYPGYGGVQSDTSIRFTPDTKSRTSQSYSTTVHLPLLSLTRLSLTMGADHWRTNGSNLVALAPSLTGSNVRVIGAERTKPDKNTGAYIQGQLALWDAMFFTYGVRSDWNPNFGDKAKVKPGRYGVSITHDMGPISVKVRGSYGRSIRPPQDKLKLAVAATTNFIAQFGPYNSQLANSYLGPEHQQGGEGGIELYLGSRGSLVVTRYNQTVDNLITLVNGVDSVRSLLPVAPSTTNCSATGGVVFFDAEGRCFRYQSENLNVGSIRNQGWEMQGSLSLGLLTMRGTYSWTKSRVIGVTPNYKSLLTGSAFQPGRQFSYLPEHTWSLGLTYSHSSGTVSLSANGIGMLYMAGAFPDDLSLAQSTNNRYMSKQPRFGTIPSTFIVPNNGYVLADLNATHRFSKRMEALLQVTNLGNYYENDLRADYVSIGRQSRLGIRLRLL